MQKNISDIERGVRVIGGTFLSTLAFWGPRNKWFLAFLIPAVEGVVGKCVLYSALGINLRDREKELANDYFPIQSSSERAAAHPLVGVS